jgi:poly(A) polymerase
MKKCLNIPVFKTISAVAGKEKVRAFVIGGFVRDCLMGNPSKDIDIVVLGDGIEFARKVADELGRMKLSIFKTFGTAMLNWNGREIEFVGARKESYQPESRKPIVYEGSLEDDQNRRDFTINSMALGLNEDNFGELLDPFGGLQDIENKIIRTPLEPGNTFSDDPLRMLRAIRFASRLGFTIDPVCFQSIKDNRERIRIISPERITEELNKVILSSRPSGGFIMLDACGLLEIIFPELFALKGIDEVDGQRHKDNFFHTLKVLDNISARTDNLWLRWAALMHDIAKPATKKYEPEAGWTFHGHDYLGYKMLPEIFRKLRLPLNEKMKYVQKMVLLHLRPIALAESTVTDSAVRRLIFDAGDDIDDLMTLCEADITSKNDARVRQYMENFKKVREKIVILEEKDKLRNFQPPVSGDHIQEAFGIPPCREVGIIKNTIKDAILDGLIPNEFNAARKLMEEKGRELGFNLKK